MWKSLGLLVLGALTGAVVVFLVARPAAGPDALSQPQVSIAAVETLSAAESEAIRDSGYAELSSIEDVLSLPSEFARREALYVIAGRSNADQLQSLIFDADRIDDTTLRDTLLAILFRRLAEVDPQTALALARVEPFSSESRIEALIWKTWARNDLDEALFTAKTQTRRVDQVAAAQALYAAFGYMGNDQTRRIREELDIEQDRQTRLRYLRVLMEDSPATLIAFISAETSALRRREYISWFAYAVDDESYTKAMSYRDSFDRKSDATLYESQVEGRFARLDPRGTLDRLVARGQMIGMAGLNNGAFQDAIRELTSQDPAAAMSYYASLNKPQAKMMAGYFIAEEMAKSDPRGALDWINSMEGMNKNVVLQGLIGSIAENDPEFALEAAQSIQGEARTQAVSLAIMRIGMDDPQRAISLIDTLPPEANPQMVKATLSQAWVQTDPDGLVAWLKTLPREEASGLASNAAQLAAFSAPKQAVQLLEFVDGQQKAMTASMLIQNLARNGNLNEARSIMANLKDEPGMERVQTAFVTGLANSDPDRAVQEAMQIQDTSSRDAALGAVAQRVVQQDPRKAVGILSSISDTQQYNRTATTIAQYWYQSDPQATLAWASTLSPGDARDQVVIGLANNFRRLGQQELDLLRSIRSPEVRMNAVTQAAYGLAVRDISAAKRLLNEVDMTQQQRATVEAMLDDFSRQRNEVTNYIN